MREFKEETGLPIDGDITYLEGSGDIKGGKPIHAFLYAGKGTEKFISSNLITTPFRFGLPENSGGRYFPVAEAQRVIHKNQQKLLDLYIASL